MRILSAFILGMIEFRISFTTLYDTQCLNEAYDYGREAAHLITLRRFDN
jgi:hypothetical protein